MENAYQHFYRKFYLQTGGFIPCKPLTGAVFPGDFFQIRNGEMICLGNIFRKGIVDPLDVSFSKAGRLSPAAWKFSEGVVKPYSGRGNGHGSANEFEFSKQILSFTGRGSFMFQGNEPESLKISNWSELEQALIIKLTQTLYSFRDLYVVTESAMADWTLVIAGSDKAELEIATDAENFGLVDIFGHTSAKTIQTRDIEFYHRESKRRPSFFKGKKLALHEQKADLLAARLMEQKPLQENWGADLFGYDFQFDETAGFPESGGAGPGLLDMLKANDLNPDTALSYFRWDNINLDDLNTFFYSQD